MRGFPLFKRLLLVIFLWPGNLTAGNGIGSQTEGRWNGFDIMDWVPSKSPYYESTKSVTWNLALENIPFNRMEKAVITFPNCDRNRVGIEMVEQVERIKGDPEESGCRATATLSEFRKITEGLFSRNVSESCAPSWAGVTGSNLFGNESAVFHTYDWRSGKSSVEVQKGRDGKWTDAFQSDITGADALYRVNVTAGEVRNGTFALVILMDHFIITDDLLAKARNETEVAGAGLVRAGLLILRLYMRPEMGITNKTSNLETATYKTSSLFDLRKCDEVFVVEKFFKDVLDNGLRAPATPSLEISPTPSAEPSPEFNPEPQEGSGWPSSPWMIFLYILLTLTVLSLGGVFLVKWINKSGNGNVCGRFTLPFHY